MEWSSFVSCVCVDSTVMLNFVNILILFTVLSIIDKCRLDSYYIQR